MRILIAIALLATASVLGCNDPFGVVPASIANRLDTLELFAVNGTDLRKPSGYSVAVRGLVRVGVDGPPVVNGPPFDFIYRIEPQAGPEFVPFAALSPPIPGSSTAGQPGLQVSTIPFDAITEAEQLGYITTKPIALTPGLVLFARSSLPNNCFLGIPYYGKIEIISFDAAARSVKFRILTDVNCGYRGLAPGLPSK